MKQMSKLKEMLYFTVRQLRCFCIKDLKLQIFVYIPFSTCINTVNAVKDDKILKVCSNPT